MQHPEPLPIVDPDRKYVNTKSGIVASIVEVKAPMVKIRRETGKQAGVSEIMSIEFFVRHWTPQV